MSTVSFAPPGNMGARYDMADVVTPHDIAKLGGIRMGDERDDSSGTAFSIRSLTEVMARSYDVLYPNLKIREILPIFTGVDPGAEMYTWKQYDMNTRAQVINDYAADAPESDVVMKEYASRLISLGTSYSYSIQDLRKARFAGIPLETRKALAARRAIENSVEQIGFFGLQAIPGTGVQSSLQFTPSAVSTSDATYQFGLTNFPQLDVTTTTNNWTLPGTSVSTITSDFLAPQALIRTRSKGIHTANTVVLPLSLEAQLNQQARSTTFTDDTLLKYLLKLSPNLQNVFFSPYLETAGKKQDGSTPGPRIIFFERSEETAQLVIPMEFEQLPPQIINYSFKVPCHMRIGGIRVSYPFAFEALDGMAG
jgi:hypothetical protein